MRDFDLMRAYWAAYRWKTRLLLYNLIRRLDSPRMYSRCERDRVYTWPLFDELEEQEQR